MEIDITTLLNMHNHESAEVYTSITAYGLAVIAFLGAIKGKLILPIRITLLCGFILYTIVNCINAIDSFKLHSALHEEIEYRLNSNQEIIKTKALGDIFKDTIKIPIWIIPALHFLVFVIVAFALLFLGEGSIKNMRLYKTNT